MKNNKGPVLLSLIAACALFSLGSTLQDQDGFPMTLLEGEENFNLALLLQGDARGNYGPCG